MLEEYLAYISDDSKRLIAVSLSVILAVLAWIKLYRSSDPLILRVLASPLPLLPILGPLAVFWIFNMPPKQPRHLRQNRWNHYGKTEFGNDDGFNDHVYDEYRRKKRGNGKGKDRPVHQGLAIMTIIVLGFFAMNFMMYGLIAMRDGAWSYTNWWGGSVFGPAAIVTGVLLIVYLFKRYR